MIIAQLFPALLWPYTNLYGRKSFPERLDLTTPIVAVFHIDQNSTSTTTCVDYFILEDINPV